MDVSDSLYGPQEIVVVDDVVTIGRTLMACSLRLLDAFPDANINVFAAARSVRYVNLEEVAQMWRPNLSTYRMDDSGFIRHDPPH